MGHAAEVWGRLSEMMERGDVSDLVELYTADALYLEPYNPPHRGNLLIHAYIKDFLGGKEDIDITEERVIESGDGTAVAIEWKISYTAGGRRWSELPRATFLVFDEAGRITYQRDYS